MPTLVIFENQLDKPAEKQFQQINLAFQNVKDWGNRISNTIPLNLNDDDASSTSSTAYVPIAGYSVSFKNQNPSTKIEVNLCINANGNIAEFAMYLDGQEVKKSVTSVNGIQMHYFAYQASINTGNHNLEIRWKTNAGTINKIANGGSSVIVSNLI